MQAYLANTCGQVQFFFWVLAFALSCLRVAAPPQKLRSFVGQMAKVSALAAQYAPRHAEIPWRVSQWPSNGSRNAAGTSDSAPEALACNPSTACDVQCQVYTNEQSGPVGELASCFLYLSKLSMDTKDMSKRSASQLSSFFSLRFLIVLGSEVSFSARSLPNNGRRNISCIARTWPVSAASSVN